MLREQGPQNKAPVPDLGAPLINVATHTGYTPELAAQFPTSAALARAQQYFARFFPASQVGLLQLTSRAL